MSADQAPKPAAKKKVPPLSKDSPSSAKLHTLQNEMEKELASTRPAPAFNKERFNSRRPSAPAVVIGPRSALRADAPSAAEHPQFRRPKSEYRDPESSAVMRTGMHHTPFEQPTRMMSYGEQMLEQWLSAQEDRIAQGTVDEEAEVPPSSPGSQIAQALAAEAQSGRSPLGRQQSASEPASPTFSHEMRSPQSRSTTSQMMSTMLGMRNSSNQLRRAELSWVEPPQQILVIKKPGDKEVHNSVRTMCEFLLRTRPEVILRMQQEEFEKGFPFPSLEEEYGERIQGWTPKEKPDEASLSEVDLVPAVDLVITIGGDGTLLFAASLFQLMAPPIMSFAMGSLGFLTPFDFKEYEKHLTSVLEGKSIVTLRTRLECEIVENAKAFAGGGLQQSFFFPDHTNGTPLVSPGFEVGRNASAPVTPRAPRRIFQTNCLNEVVIDRGPSSYLSAVDIFCDGKHITCVQGDGVIISTPTGSTAYSVAAGGSMVHPTVPCIAITPVAPHSLSFRPIILPATVELVIRVSPTGRGSAWVSMDGKNRQELHKGDDLRVTTSVWPVPTLNTADSSADWFEALASCLNWNLRERQKPQ